MTVTTKQGNRRLHFARAVQSCHPLPADETELLHTYIHTWVINEPVYGYSR